ncbi:MAG: rRNA maturation RNase YbeY [Ignavibacteriales bacterium]|nr:rRNA maturation RNase YbeY [Ignavibacteriales bacterium]
MVKGVTVAILQDIPVQKNAIHKIVAFLKKELQFSIQSLEITFVTRADIHSINKSYLNHDYMTDIITFDYSDTAGNLVGELIISPDIAHANAKKYNIPYTEELVRLVIHGILHLLNYDDKTAPEKKIMFSLQEALVRKSILFLK